MKKYDAIDNLKAAEALRKQLQLELADLRASVEYDFATTVCDNCPMVERMPETYEEYEFGVSYAATCCKHDGSMEESYERQSEVEKTIQALIDALMAYYLQ